VDRWIKLIATFFYFGEFPVAPGTAGSFAGLLLFLAVFPSTILVAATFGVLLALGFFSAGRAEKIFNKKDPRQVVIDEVAGIFLVYFMIPVHALSLGIGFLLYRLLDITKPFPVRRLEHLPGSYGIMCDDLLCGVYANLLLQILFKLNILH
jgi:phosphatidylglycerophosphatase A